MAAVRLVTLPIEWIQTPAYLSNTSRGTSYDCLDHFVWLLRVAGTRSVMRAGTRGAIESWSEAIELCVCGVKKRETYRDEVKGFVGAWDTQSLKGKGRLASRGRKGDHAVFVGAAVC